MKFLSQIDKFVQEKELEKANKRKRTSHHPSGLTKCLRRQYYEWQQTEVSNATDTVAVYRMALGSMIHSLFSDAIEKMHYDSIEVEKELLSFFDELTYPFHGYIDIYVQENMKAYAIEVKSSFGFFIRQIKDTSSPRLDDVIQTVIYQVMDEAIEQSSLIYLARDSFYRTEFIFPRSERLVSLIRTAMIDRAKAIEYHVENKILPAREYNAVISKGEVKKQIQRNNIVYKSDWQCDYCPFANRCYAEEIQRGVDFISQDNSNDVITEEIQEEIKIIMG